MRGGPGHTVVEAPHPLLLHQQPPIVARGTGWGIHRRHWACWRTFTNLGGTCDQALKFDNLLRTQDSGLRTQDSGLTVHDPRQPL